MIEFRSINSSSAGNAYLVTDGDARPLLIDAGITADRLHRALRFKTHELIGVLLSHAHGDHSKSIRALLKLGIPCYASLETWGALGCDDSLARVLKPTPADEDERHPADGPRQIGAWTVTPFDAVHDVGTLGFVIDGPSGDRLLFLTDSCFSPFTFGGLNVIACEVNFSEELLRKNVEAGLVDPERYRRTLSTHMSLEVFERLLAANDLGKVRSIHALHLSSDNSHAEDFRRRIQAASGVPTYICDK